MNRAYESAENKLDALISIPVPVPAAGGREVRPHSGTGVGSTFAGAEYPGGEKEKGLNVESLPTLPGEGSA